MKTFITFGQIHKHMIKGVYYDKDCVAAIESINEEEGRGKAFALFGNKWHESSFGEEYDKEKLVYYPRGVIEVHDVSYIYHCVRIFCDREINAVVISETVFEAIDILKWQLDTNTTSIEAEVIGVNLMNNVKYICEEAI